MAVRPVNSILSDIVGDYIVRVLNENTLALQQSAARLTSGLRIQNAGDDPGGVGSVVRVGNQAKRVTAAQTGIANVTSYVDTQAGFLNDVETALNRMSQLSTLAQDSTTTSATRSSYQIEFADLQAFVSNAGAKTFNNVQLFTDSTLNAVISEDGATFGLTSLNYSAAGASGGLSGAYSSSIDLTTTSAASTALNSVSTAIANLGIMQARVGSNSQILGLYDDTLSVLKENLTAVKDRVQATDIAAESNEFARLNALVQGGTNVLAQWNVLRQNLLTLLK